MRYNRNAAKTLYKSPAIKHLKRYKQSQNALFWYLKPLCKGLGIVLVRFTKPKTILFIKFATIHGILFAYVLP